MGVERQCGPVTKGQGGLFHSKPEHSLPHQTASLHGVALKSHPLSTSPSFFVHFLKAHRLEQQTAQHLCMWHVLGWQLLAMTHSHGQAPPSRPLLPAQTHLSLSSEKLSWKKQALPRSQWCSPNSGWLTGLSPPIPLPSPSQGPQGPIARRPRQGGGGLQLGQLLLGLSSLSWFVGETAIDPTGTWQRQ